MMSRENWPTAGGFKAAIAAGFFIFAVGTPIFAAEQPMLLPVDPTPLVAETDAGDRSFSIEIADDQGERSAGLMYRESMDDDHGMLFVFDQTQSVGFWMKNTPMALDLIFIGQDGKVRDIKHGDPLSEALIAPEDPVRFVLELKAGTAEKEGIEDGDQIRHPAINAAPGAGNAG
jgi:uncharacterized membrane protein (UPF0127 family)